MALVFAGAGAAFPQSAYLVADLGQTELGSTFIPGWWMDVLEFDGNGYFFHDDGIHGAELWRTDGTRLGTHLLRDGCPGICSVKPSSVPFGATLGTRFLFAGNDGVHGSELWTSDGTAVGTSMLFDLRPGPAPSNPSQFLTAGGQVFFFADDGLHGRSLWRTDGTTKGTFFVKRFLAGSGDFATYHLAVGSGHLFVGVSNGGLASGLWRSDGTEPGTTKLANAEPVAFTPDLKNGGFRTLPDGILIFAATTTANGTEPWRSDGTSAGTYALGDLAPGPDGSEPAAFEEFQGSMLFVARSPSIFSPLRLWRTNGTIAGTQLVPVPPDFVARSGYGSYAKIGGSKFVFAGEVPGAGVEPWSYDGTNVVSLGDLRPGSSSSLDIIDGAVFDLGVFAATGARVTFLADDGTHGLEFWSTDGTPGGTSRVSDLFDDLERPRFDSYVQFSRRLVSGSALLLRRWDPATGFRLVRSDGTAAGTFEVEELSRGRSSFLSRWNEDSLPFNVVGPTCAEAAGDRLVFKALDGLTRNEVWGTDGSEAGTERLALGLSGDESSANAGCGAFGGSVYWATRGSEPELWKSGGTPESTQALATLTSGSTSGEVRPYFVSSPSDFYFGASGALFESDGTTKGTAGLGEVADLRFGGLAISGDLVYYSDFELYAIDPDSGKGPVEIDLNGADVSYPENFVPFGDHDLLFTAWDDAIGGELWRSDGTPEGTFLVKDIRPGPAGAFSNYLLRWSDEGAPPNAIGLDDVALLSANDGTHGEELWVSDGTFAGTRLLLDIYPGEYPSTPRFFTRFGDRVFFTAESESEGLELWSTDGTLAGTAIVKDIVPGAGSSIPDDLVVRDGVLYFSAWTPAWGREAWKSDGTAAGTIRISDVAPGPKSSSPQRFARAGGRLYFSATDQIHGYELWAISDDGLLPLFLDGFENESTSRWSDTGS